MRGSGKIEQLSSDGLIGRLLTTPSRLDDAALAAQARLLLNEYLGFADGDEAVHYEACRAFNHYKIEPWQMKDVAVFSRREQGSYWSYRHFFHVRDEADRTRTLCGKRISGRAWHQSRSRGMWRRVADNDGRLEITGKSINTTYYSTCSSCQRLAATLPTPSAELDEPWPWTPLNAREEAKVESVLAQVMRRLRLERVTMPSDEQLTALNKRLEATMHRLAAERAYEERWWETTIDWQALLEDAGFVPAEPDRRPFIGALIRGRWEDLPHIQARLINSCYPDEAAKLREMAEDGKRFLLRWGSRERLIVSELLKL